MFTKVFSRHFRLHLLKLHILLPFDSGHVLIEMTHVTKHHFGQMLSKDAQLFETLHLVCRQIQDELIDDVVKNYVDF